MHAVMCNQVTLASDQNTLDTGKGTSESISLPQAGKLLSREAEGTAMLRLG